MWAFQRYDAGAVGTEGWAAILDPEHTVFHQNR